MLVWDAEAFARRLPTREPKDLGAESIKEGREGDGAATDETNIGFENTIDKEVN